MDGAKAPQLEIRQAARGDAGLILEFIRALAEYERLAHEVVATADRIEETLFGKHPGAEVVIAEWEGEPAGFALYFSSYSTFLGLPGMYLEDLFVHPEYRGRGIGKALLAHLARIVVDRGWGRLDWSVLDWNRPAIDFYLSLGARPLDEWTQYRLQGEALKAVAEGIGKA
jgi:GNAT superfamily N-acetyltransferase